MDDSGCLQRIGFISERLFWPAARHWHKPLGSDLSRSGELHGAEWLLPSDGDEGKRRHLSFVNLLGCSIAVCIFAIACSRRFRLLLPRGLFLA
jgi:hypothetical protein